MNGLGIVIAILGLGLLIAVHEFGHFLVGKLLGLKVLEFFLGLPLGPKIVGVKRGETTYGVSSVLFGGYVKFAELLSISELKVEGIRPGSLADQAGFKKGDLITAIDGKPVKEWRDVYDLLTENAGKMSAVSFVSRGMDQELRITADELSGIAISKDEAVTFEDIPRTFEAQKTWKRGLIVFAGPAMNLVLAVVIIFLIALVGFPKPTTTLERVLPRSPASVSGIRAGDRIISIAGQEARSWDQVTAVIRHNAGKKIEITVERGGHRFSYSPQLRVKSGQGLLGVVTKVVRQPENPPAAAREGISFIGQTTVLIAKFLGTLVTAPRKVLPFVRSPIGIVRETAPIATRDILDYLATLAGLSVAIGIFNLLPIPPLDGGRIFISGIEGVIRRPISREAMLVANAVGFSLLLMLMTYAVIGDIFRKAIPGGG